MIVCVWEVREGRRGLTHGAWVTIGHGGETLYQPGLMVEGQVTTQLHREALYWDVVHQL